MSDPKPNKGFTAGNVLGIAEAVVGIALAVLAFVKGAGPVPSPVAETSGIFAAIHGIGHGLGTH